MNEELGHAVGGRNRRWQEQLDTEQPMLTLTCGGRAKIRIGYWCLA